MTGVGEMISSEQTSKNRWLSYYDLRDACKEDGCPICRLLARVSQRFLDGLFYERVNDVETRQRIHASSGFCNWHAWQAAEVPDSHLGIAIIYENLLKMFEQRLLSTIVHGSRVGRSDGWLHRLRRRVKKTFHLTRILERTELCHVCQEVAFFEDLYLRVLLDSLVDEEFADAYERNVGLCLPHLDLALTRFADHKNLSLLLRDEVKRIESLRKELSEFVRKSDFQYRHEPKGAEVTAWRRAIELAAGKRELFGNHLFHPPVLAAGDKK